MEYITKQVLTSKHDCVFDLFDTDLRMPNRLVNCKSFTRSCSENFYYDSFPVGTLYCAKKSNRVLKESQYHSKFCIKDKYESIKSLCVNKIREFIFYPSQIL